MVLAAITTVASAGSIAGCGDDDDDDDDDNGEMMAMPVYGAPIDKGDASTDAAMNSPQDDGGVVPVYGLAPGQPQTQAQQPTRDPGARKDH